MRHAMLSLMAAVACSTAQAAAIHCEPQTQIDVRAIPAQALLVGEVHGTKEVPAFVGALACSVARAGRPVVLALERQGDEQAAFDAYLASDGGPAARAALTGQRGWTMQPQFGLGSEAMLALVEEMRQLRQAGAPVAVLAMLRWVRVDLPRAPREQTATAAPLSPLRAGMYDRLMAESVASTVAQHPEATVIALAGNLHTRIPAASKEGSMAQMLAELLPVFVIGLESGQPWSAWNCRAIDDCGPARYPASPMYDRSSRVDAVVRLEAVSASPPARAASR